jgi:hypothetical protein
MVAHPAVTQPSPEGEIANTLSSKAERVDVSQFHPSLAGDLA